MFLQYGHYVAASRVTTLEGLQIISWKPELISVNQGVKEHMDYLKTQRKVQLCYTTVYNMVTGMKCCFLNTRSVYKDIEDVKANYNICPSDVIFVAKTRLIYTDDDDTYKYHDLKSHVEMISYGTRQPGHCMDLYAMLQILFGY